VKIYDVVVIGGGPAGMMAAGRAGERGLSVLVLEKNPGLGKKLLITGGGRCNVTNNKPDVRTMLAKYKGNDKFLHSPFSQFDVKSTLEFFNSRGMPTKEENENRIFPVSDRAQSVWDVLYKYLKQGGVKVETNAEVSGIKIDKDTKDIVISVKGKNGGDIITKSCVVATGGTSRPETGSTGEGYKFLKKLGHTIIENDFALVPVKLSDVWVKNLGGVSLQNIKLTSFQNGVKQESLNGKILFTHFGISGPTVLNMSKGIGELLKYGDATLELDIFPKKDIGTLRKELHELLTNESNKKIKNTLGKMVPTALALALLEIAKIDPETVNNILSTENRKKIVNLIKAVPLHVSGLLGADKAIISSGGVKLEEVDMKTMQSRIIKGLYLVGDILNIDRPSGGYSLQLCWTTGYVAGSSI
jgi:predicted Rossmann fold flavoprotein